MSTRAPEKIRLVSWNIDGLDARNREARMEAVCSVIQKRQAEVCPCIKRLMYMK